MDPRRVVVIGGGIAGLAAAYRIREEARERGLALDLRVLEAAATPGGKIASQREDGFLCETGPNGFLDNEPAALRLVDDLGLRDALQRSNDTSRRRYLVRKGRLVEMHMNPVKFLKSELLSRRAKMRMGWEYFVGAKKDDADETVGDFGRRRLGKEFTAVMLDSMVSGIYAGDVDRLSVKAAFPKIVDLEREHGGLFRGMVARQKERRQRIKAAKAEGTKASERKVEAGPGGVLHSFAEGMGQPIAALHAELGDAVVRCDAPVARLEPGTPHRVHLADGEVFEADAVVLTVPAPAMSQLLRGVAEDAAQALSEIPVAGVHVVCLGYRHDQIGESVEGFGALIPRQEKIRILGSIFSSSTFDGRAPKGFALLTNMIGGRHDPAANELSDEELEAAVRRDVSALLHIDGDPVFARVFRWARGIPQYEIGHLDRVARARDDVGKVGAIFLGGNSVAGVSFNQCIAHAEELAGQVCDCLGDVPTIEETHS